jgi:hypothetical protein
MTAPEQRRPAERHLVALALMLSVFALSVFLRWQPPLVGTDGVHYIVGGVGLLTNGVYLNPSGTPELWFPPVFPILIGIATRATGLDPVYAARAVTLATTVALLLVFWITVRRASIVAPVSVGAAGLLVAVNPLVARQAMDVLSESTATLLMLGAFVVWMRMPSGSWRSALVLGVLSALAYLTRPECVIPFAVWTAIDCLRRWERNVWGRYLAAWVAFFLCAVPYVIYLRQQTGNVALSNKFQITLSAGRSLYYGCPREYIDPSRLEMTIADCPHTIGQEARRVASNLASLAQRYMVVLFGGRQSFLLVFAVVALAATGLFRMWQRNRRLTLGTLAFFGVLPVMAVLDVKVRYLHLTIPAVAMILSAAGGFGGTYGERRAWISASSAVIAITAALLVMPWLSVAPGADAPIAPASKEAGLAMRGQPSGAIYENGTSVAYYAGMKHFELPLNDLPTIVRYINAKHTEPVYLAVSDALRLDPSVRNLLSDPSPLPEVLTVRNGWVVLRIFRVR